MSLKIGPIIILTLCFLKSSTETSKVTFGSDLVSLGKISILLSLIAFNANLVALITDFPISPYSPDSGTINPILIFSFEYAF